ncbi:hypothetical protein [Selenomonas sp. AB3002]|uniref:hypothetical protein n=1 Tax=Selenomonas sp. AB3002 TaxID=1392502 RepID=UPI0004969413
MAKFDMKELTKEQIQKLVACETAEELMAAGGGFSNWTGCLSGEKNTMKEEFWWEQHYENKHL